MKRPLCLLLMCSLLSASIASAQEPKPPEAEPPLTCEGDARWCGRRLVTAMDDLHNCRDEAAAAHHRADATVAAMPTEVKIEYKTPPLIWVILGVSLIASTALGIYTVVNANSALDRIR